MEFFKINKNLVAFLLFVLFWASLLTFSGTLTSGYHFTDDHEIITINKNIKENGLFNASKSILKEDLGIRFRPVYYLHRIALVKLLGTNFLLWSVYNAILAIFTSFFLFLFLYLQGYKFVNALLLPFLTLIGAQSAIWWKLGPCETIGLFLLSLSLFLLVNSIFRAKRYQLLGSLIFMILASLSKESFTIFIPAYILILLWLKWKRQPYINVSCFIRGNIILVIILLLFLSIEGGKIIFAIGTNKIGYAGIDDSFSIGHYLTFIYSHLRYNKYSYLIICGLFFLLQNVKSWKINLSSDFRKLLPYLFNALILMAVILPQYLLYSKSNIFERYLLPLNLGLSFFVIFLSDEIFRSEEISLLSKRTYIFLILLVTFSFLRNETIPDAKIFADEGRSTNKFLSSIIAATKNDDSILVVLNGYKNYEWGFSIIDYLANNADRRNIRFYTIDNQLNNDLEKDIDKRFSLSFDNIIIKELNNNFSCIAILPFSNNIEIKTRIDSNYVYRRNDFGDFTVYTRRERTPDLKK